MQHRRRLVLLALLSLLMWIQPAVAIAAPAPDVYATSPRGAEMAANALPGLASLDSFYKKLGAFIARKTGRSSVWSVSTAKTLACLVAKGATKAGTIHVALNFAQPQSPVSLDEAVQISRAIADFERANPDLMKFIKVALKLIC